MKRIIFSACIFMITLSLQAQVKGNSSYERQYKSENNNADNANYNNKQNANKNYGGLHSTTPNAYFLNDSVFEVEADVMLNRRADSYVAILSLSQTSGTLDSAYLLINGRIEKLIQNLPSNINKNEVYVDFVSLVPTYEIVEEKKVFSKNTATEVPSGYEISKTVHIPYSKSDMLEGIMAAATKGEIYDLVKTDYVINNSEEIYDTLRREAVRLIQKKKADFEKLGMKFVAKYTVIADDLSSTYPIERYKSYQAMGSTGQYYDKTKKTYTSAKKHITYYYDKINYNETDKVINARVVEPVVQFMYNLKIRYTYAKM